ncbi:MULTISPECIES: hypothetical protein [unclassified Salegentibacter]|jgi:flagellar motor component MotA|uniref:hypothetical protein n=1 Tax=unclassified Salegentibacter TaxID=2633436 RepID=UPI00094A3558|nr:MULTISPECIES: hypothetical protein [unclassified Salegentibacter]APS40165.1 hypothetical protein AO058_15330 [Salegentibacter sp. T436]|tara:strand:+ start:114 stop:299 length:186 start_codon:yes stop_codon:yes gene_type:complete
MKKISTKVKIIGIVSIFIWIIGSYLIYNGTNGKGVSIATGVIIIAGLYSQISKDQKENSEL